MCIGEFWQSDMLNMLFPFIHVLNVDVIIKEAFGLGLLLSDCISHLPCRGLDKVGVCLYVWYVFLHLLLISITVFGQIGEQSTLVSLFSRIDSPTAIIMFSHTEISAALLICIVLCFSQLWRIFVKYYWVWVDLYSLLHFVWRFHAVWYLLLWLYVA